MDFQTQFQGQQHQARQLYHRMTTSPLQAFLFFVLTIVLIIPLILLAVGVVIIIAIYFAIRRFVAGLFGRGESTGTTTVSPHETVSGPVIDVEVTDRK